MAGPDVRINRDKGKEEKKTAIKVLSYLKDTEVQRFRYWQNMSFLFHYLIFVSFREQKKGGG